MRTFHAITNLLTAALVTGAPSHVVLLASDSGDYRRWVYLQIVLYLVGAWLLWRVRRFKLGALAAFAMLSALGIYINAVRLNYGNGPVLWVAPFVFLCLYVSLALVARKQFVLSSAVRGT